MASTAELVAYGIELSYGNRLVLDKVDLEIEPGTVLGLLGANGAGKSSLISVATGLRRPNAGKVLIGGIDVHKDRLRAANRIGFAPQTLGVYPSLTVWENLMIFAELSSLRGSAARSRVAEVLEFLELSAESKRSVSELSGGQQRRVHTAMALVGRPSLLFLDEPTVGADLGSRRQILGAVQALAARGTAVLYTSHVLSEFEELNAEIAVLYEGRITERASVQELLAKHGSTKVELHFTNEVPTLEGWAQSDLGTMTRSTRSSPGALLAETLGELGNRSMGLHDLIDVQIHQPSLEEVFLALTGTSWENEATSAASEEISDSGNQAE